MGGFLIRKPPFYIKRKEGIAMKNIKCKNWWKAAGVRCVKTMAQAAIATIGASTLITEIDWLMVGSATLMAGVLSLLTSISGLPEVEVE